MAPNSESNLRPDFLPSRLRPLLFLAAATLPLGCCCRDSISLEEELLNAISSSQVSCASSRSSDSPSSSFALRRQNLQDIRARFFTNKSVKDDLIERAFQWTSKLAWNYDASLGNKSSLQCPKGLEGYSVASKWIMRLRAAEELHPKHLITFELKSRGFPTDDRKKFIRELCGLLGNCIVEIRDVSTADEIKMQIDVEDLQSSLCFVSFMENFKGITFDVAPSINRREVMKRYPSLVVRGFPEAFDSVVLQQQFGVGNVILEAQELQDGIEYLPCPFEHKSEPTKRKNAQFWMKDKQATVEAATKFNFLGLHYGHAVAEHGGDSHSTASTSGVSKKPSEKLGKVEAIPAEQFVLGVASEIWPLRCGFLSKDKMPRPTPHAPTFRAVVRRNVSNKLMTDEQLFKELVSVLDADSIKSFPDPTGPLSDFAYPQLFLVEFANAAAMDEGMSRWSRLRGRYNAGFVCVACNGGSCSSHTQAEGSSGPSGESYTKIHDVSQSKTMQ